MKLRKGLKKQIEHLKAVEAINKSKNLQSVAEHEKTKAELEALKEKLRAKECNFAKYVDDSKKYVAAFKQVTKECKQLKNEAEVSWESWTGSVWNSHYNIILQCSSIIKNLENLSNAQAKAKTLLEKENEQLKNAAKVS